MRLVAVVLLLGACVIEEPRGKGVLGSSSDMSTQPGDYAGYRVVTPCQGTWTDVGVTGMGSVELTTTEDIAVAGQELYTQLADIRSIHSWGGYGLACEAGIGTSIWLDDWRDVDGLIARVGEWLQANDLRLQVGIKVDGIPVPLSN